MQKIKSKRTRKNNFLWNNLPTSVNRGYCHVHDDINFNLVEPNEEEKCIFFYKYNQFLNDSLTFKVEPMFSTSISWFFTNR